MRDKPGKNAVSWRFRTSVCREFTIYCPLKVNGHQTACQGAQAILPGGPNALSQMSLVDAAMQLLEFLCSSQPLAPDVDEIYICRDKAREHIRVVGIPSQRPPCDDQRYLSVGIVASIFGLRSFAHCTGQLMPPCSRDRRASG